MRHGWKVYDADTRVAASAEVLDPYLASTVKQLVPDLDNYRVPRR